MKQQLEKAILITNITSALDWAITIESNKDRYVVPKTVQAGGPTKAFTQLQEIRPMVGDTVNAMVEEEEKEYTGKDGQKRMATNRKILYFITKRDSIPVVQTAPVAIIPPVSPPNQTFPQTPSKTPNYQPEDFRIQMIQDDIADLKARVAELEDSKLPTIEYEDTSYIPAPTEEVKVSDLPF